MKNEDDGTKKKSLKFPRNQRGNIIFTKQTNKHSLSIFFFFISVQTFGMDFILSVKPEQATLSNGCIILIYYTILDETKTRTQTSSLSIVNCDR